MASPAVDGFIDGAKIDRMDSAVAAKPAQAKIYNRIIFSLTSETCSELERLSLLPHHFHLSRSDVILAAIAFLANQGDEKVFKLLKEPKDKD